MKGCFPEEIFLYYMERKTERWSTPSAMWILEAKINPNIYLRLLYDSSIEMDWKKKKPGDRKTNNNS